MSEFTVGAGRVYLSDRRGVSYGERYVGNSPGFSYTPNIETMKNYDTRDGIVVLSGSEIISRQHEFMLTLDVINDENLAMYFMRQYDSIDIPTDEFTKVLTLVRGNLYDLGAQAVREVTATSDGLAFDLSKVSIDYALGLLLVHESSDVYTGQELTLSFLGNGISRTYQGTVATPYAGALRYVEDNLVGPSRMLIVPSLLLYPDASVEFKTSDWRNLVFRAEVTSEPYWRDRALRDDYSEGSGFNDFNDLTTSDPEYPDDYGDLSNG